ncbi:MAG: RNA 2',3'-cyclic phosphodiesterase [Phenylobacterium sp.]|jgi:2'-5' RNA ligase|uniref:RNA 2',3'-cyclic phosphodiesterase n=1 Tax=Phenylobacterium ferrooxidans TaxID=2982689 RepID=A0ABW6CKJ8_9CAUL|nr:RNA 2',3'-cyclic phosphodiesterase [Phenylobacterium sp.]
MIRLFAAVAVPSELGEGLQARQNGLGGANWRPVEAFHITLRFFGDVREDVADDLHLELERISAAPMTLELEGVGSFGEGPDLHAVWAGVRENDALRRLAKACETAARRSGLKAEARAYRPHVTLAYLKRPDVAEVAAWLSANALLKSPPFEVSSFGLYSSLLLSGGSRYQLEQIYRLR